MAFYFVKTTASIAIMLCLKTQVFQRTNPMRLLSNQLPLTQAPPLSLLPPRELSGNHQGSQIKQISIFCIVMHRVPNYLCKETQPCTGIHVSNCLKLYTASMTCTPCDTQHRAQALN